MHDLTTLEVRPAAVAVKTLVETSTIIMSCPEIETDLQLIAAELKTEREWLANCRHREKAARREAEFAEDQIRAFLLQQARIERALEDCRTYGGRR